MLLSSKWKFQQFHPDGYHFEEHLTTVPISKRQNPPSFETPLMGRLWLVHTLRLSTWARRSWKRWHVNCGVLARSRRWMGPWWSWCMLPARGLNINLTRGCQQWLLCFMFLLVMFEGDTNKIQDGSLLVGNGSNWPYKWAPYVELWPYL